LKPHQKKGKVRGGGKEKTNPTRNINKGGNRENKLWNKGNGVLGKRKKFKITLGKRGGCGPMAWKQIKFFTKRGRHRGGWGQRKKKNKFPPK